MQRIPKDQFFLLQTKIGRKIRLAVDEQSENTPSSSDTVIDFLKQSESRPSASTSSVESQFTHVAESETWFLLCMLTLCLKLEAD